MSQGCPHLGTGDEGRIRMGICLRSEGYKALVHHGEEWILVVQGGELVLMRVIMAGRCLRLAEAVNGWIVEAGSDRFVLEREGQVSRTIA